ncbi:MAG: NIL domain-containing protein [Acidimicrobiales bacterium]
MAGVRVRLTFPEHLITEPLVGRMMRRYDVLPNIRRANISDSLGWMVCEVTGERPVVEEALAWLAGEGVQVDRLGDVVEG